jgi:Holliday junction resolvase
MTQYAKGARFERRVQKYLEERGWFTIRSAGSHKVADLVCLRGGGVLLIQCKLNGRISPAEREQLLNLARENKCQAVFAYRDGRKLVIQSLE